MKTVIKTLGIIGGFGPEATSDFYLALIKECKKLGMSHQPHIIMWNVPVPAKFEENLLLHQKGQERFKPLLVQAAVRLEQIGVDAVVLPCNTLHIFANNIKRSIKIPFINIIDTVMETLKIKNIQRIGLLGTSITVNNNLFLSTNEIKFILPNRILQNNLDVGFHERVINGNSKQLHSSVRKAINVFKKQNIHDILLASTDLHNAYPTQTNLHIHDTLEMLAEKTAKLFL